MDPQFVYKGDTLQGVRHGRGQYNYPGGVFRYNGPWQHGVKHGREGSFSLPGYFEYVGQFVDGQMTGRGRRDWADGRSYEGDWLNGEMHGKGTWSNSTLNESYDGDFVSNKRHGHGTLKLSNGDIYDGNFCMHRYQGRGAYLKEKSFVVDGYFEDGYVHGTGKATWHKKGFYEGSWYRGRMVGDFGLFSAMDGSYQCIGPFAASRPAMWPTRIHAICDRTAVPVLERAAVEKGKKDTKKPPAKGKDATSDMSACTATVPRGTQIGALHIALSMPGPEGSEITTEGMPPLVTDDPLSLPYGGVAFGRFPLPLNELRRRVAVRMRPYVAPPAAPEVPKGAKGKAAIELIPIVSMEPLATPPPPVALWLQQTSLQSAAESWSRFPPNCIKFQRGKCHRADSTTSLVKVLKNASDGVSAADSTAEFIKGPHGVLSTPLDASSYLSVALPTVALASKFLAVPMPEQLSVFMLVVDFCLNVDFYQSMVLEKEVTAVSIPLFKAFSRPSAEEKTQEGRDDQNLALYLNIPVKRGLISESVSTESAAVVAVEPGHETELAVVLNDIDWANATWELVCGSRRHTWTGGLAAADNWHSCGISVKHSTWSSGEEAVNCAGLDLVVDGANRRKVEDNSSYLGNTVVDWLKSVGLMGAPEIAEESPNQAHEDDVDEGAVEVVKCPAIISGDLKLVFGGDYDGGDGGFVGALGSVAVCNRYDMCDLVESTSCFADWVKEKLTLLQKEEDASSAAAAVVDDGSPKQDMNEVPDLPGVPADCIETMVVTALCRGGYAVLDGLVVPMSTPEGTYVLEISDDVDAACRAPSNGNLNSCVDRPSADQEPLGQAEEPMPPQSISSMCEMAPYVYPNTSILIAVVAPLA